MFNVLNLRTHSFVLDADTGEPAIYETGLQATSIAMALTINPPFDKHQPRPMPIDPDADWRARERSRFADGTYRPLPSVFKRYTLPDHFAHVSKVKPMMIAHTPDTMHGVADRQKRVGVATYLDTYFPSLTPRRKSWLIALHLRAVGGGVDLKFAKTPDEIVKVYTSYDKSEQHDHSVGHSKSVAVSCMRSSSDSFSSHPHHPVEAYGNSDLQVAYITNSDGETLCRALVWPARKLYSRVYGDSSAFHTALQKLGYKQSSYFDDNNPSFEGARIRAIPHGDGFVCPYVDECGSANLSADGKWLVLTAGDDGDCDTRQTDGVTGTPEPGPEYTCERCDEGCDETHMVYVLHRSLRREQSWCPYCAENHTFYCEYSNDTWSENTDSTTLGNGETWCDYYLSANATLCDHSGEYWPNSDCETVIIDNDGNEEVWCQDARYADAVEHEGEWYEKSVDLPFPPML